MRSLARMAVRFQLALVFQRLLRIAGVFPGGLAEACVLDRSDYRVLDEQVNTANEMAAAMTMMMNACMMSPFLLIW